MGFIRRAFRGIRRAFRRVVNVGKGIFNAVTKPIRGLAKTFGKIAGSILRSLPFGAAMAGFVGAFLSNPFALMSGAALGALHALFGGARSSRDLAYAQRQISRSRAYCHPMAHHNCAHLCAYHHARVNFHVHHHHHHYYNT